MFSIEQRHQDWVVLEHGEVVSVHPTRVEAERAVVWLMVHTDGHAGTRLGIAGADLASPDRPTRGAVHYGLSRST
jgi:hypothetical protein